MRRRVPARPVPDDTPALERLLRFRGEDWTVDERPPWTWPTDRASVGLWYGIKAHQQWLEAGRRYRAEHGISRGQWEAMRRERGISVPVY